MASSRKVVEREGVRWTAAARARLFGSRRPIAELDAAPLNLGEAWARLRRSSGSEPGPAPFDADPKLEKLVATVRKELEAAKPPAKTTLEREELRAGLALYECDAPRVTTVSALVAFWVGHQGLAFAVRRLWSPMRFAFGAEVSDDAQRLTVEDMGRLAPLVSQERPAEPWWLALRRHALAASDDECAAALEAARELSVSPVILAATFCRDPKAADALAAKEKGSNASMDSVHLLGAVSKPQLALRLARKQLYGSQGAEHHAFHLVDNLGRDAAPVLLALLEDPPDAAAARCFAEAAVLADAEACRTHPRKKLSRVAASALDKALR